MSKPRNSIYMRWMTMIDVRSTGAYVLISVTLRPARVTKSLHSSSVRSTAPNISIICRSCPEGQIAAPVLGSTISSRSIFESGPMAGARFLRISTDLSSDQLCRMDRR